MPSDPDILTAREYGRLLEELLEPSAGYARSILGRQTDAEDAVQQAALRGLERLVTYDPRRPFKSWWYTILKHCCIDLQRKRRLTVSIAAIDVTDPSQSDRQAWSDLADAMDTLPEAQQEILRLRYFGGLAYREIADVLAIPTGTVMSRLYNARKALATAMEVTPQ